MKDFENENEKQTKNSITQEEEVLKSEKSLIQRSKILSLEKNNAFIEKPERWFNLVAFCLCLFANGFQWLGFSLISCQFSYHYEKSLWKINLFSTLFFIIYPFASIPEAIFVEKYSIRKGLFVASLFTFLGAFFKLFAYKDTTLSVCYIGQILPALFRPMLLNSPGKIASNWFGQNKRTLICSICCLSDTLGILIGYLWSCIFVKDKDSDEIYKEQIFRHFLSEFILIFLFCIPALFIKENQENLPSLSRDKSKLKVINIWESFKLLMGKKSFIFLLISFFFIAGYYFFIGTIFYNLLFLYDIGRKKSNIIFCVSFIAGIISSIIISIILDKNNKFKFCLINLSILALIFQALLTFLFEWLDPEEVNTFKIGLVLYILIHSIVIPFYTIGMNYVSEIAYPVDESISWGIIISFTQICGLISFYLLDNILNDVEKEIWLTNVIILAFFFIGFIFIFFSNEQLIRGEIEYKGGQKGDNDKIRKNPNILPVEFKQNEKIQ